MSVLKVFWQDSYLTSLPVKIVAVDKDEVRVDQTIAYAFSGGQASDVGTIGNFNILKAYKDELDIVYVLEQDHTLSVGDEVIMEIDWDSRYKIMKLHFAGELILESVLEIYPELGKIGANVTTSKARVDFDSEKPLTPILEQLEKRINDIIVQDLPIETGFSDKSAQRRYWKIEGYSIVPCGGTHVKSTGEIGPVKLKRVNLGKNKERIEVTLLT